MRYSLFHIVLSLFLTLAVTDYVWYDLIDQDQVSIELEIESSEEIDENKLSETKHDRSDDLQFHSPSHFSTTSIFSGVFKVGDSFRPLTPDNDPKLYIAFCQLKLHC